MEVSGDFYALCKNCGNMHFNGFFGYYREGDGTDHPEGTVYYQESLAYPCPYCQNNDVAKIVCLDDLPTELGLVLYVLPKLWEANPTCIFCPHARIIVGDSYETNGINTDAMLCSKTGQAVREADNMPCEWRLRGK